MWHFIQKHSLLLEAILMLGSDFVTDIDRKRRSFSESYYYHEFYQLPFSAKQRVPSVTEDIIPVSEQRNTGEEVSFQRKSSHATRDWWGGLPWQGRPGWAQPPWPNSHRTNRRHFLNNRGKIKQWRDGPCYSCLLQEKKRRRLVTKVKIAELQSSLDSKAAFTPLQSLPTSPTLRWSTARRRGWQTQKCTGFFSDSSFCTVSLLPVSGMLHPIFGILHHSDHWVTPWDMMAISSCVASELPLQEPWTMMKRLRALPLPVFCLQTVRTVPNYFPFLEQPHFSLLLLFPGS